MPGMLLSYGQFYERPGMGGMSGGGRGLELSPWQGVPSLSLFLLQNTGFTVCACKFSGAAPLAGALNKARAMGGLCCLASLPS